MQRRLMTVSLAAAGFASLLGSRAYAQATLPGVDPVHNDWWDENNFVSNLGATVPSGAWTESVQGLYNSSNPGFSTISFADAGGFATINDTPNITTSYTSPTGALYQINAGTYRAPDARLYEIDITNPSAFSVHTSTSAATGDHQILTLFNSAGGAIAAEVGGFGGGTQYQLDAANDNITTPGLYWLGFAHFTSYPKNNEGVEIFGTAMDSGLLTGANLGVYYPTASDPYLATNTALAWSGAPNDLGPATSSGEPPAWDALLLTGTSFAVVPEPTSLGMLGVVAVGMLSRRRKVAR